MKQFVLILFVGFATLTFSQDGFKLIKKAEKKIQRGNYEAAMLLLEKADSANYGFCGNAWWEAHDLILIKRITIYDRQKDYQQCLNLLNEEQAIMYFNSDSLKMTYFIRLYGKENIKKELDVFLDAFQYNHQEQLVVDFTFFKDYLISHRAIFNIVRIAHNIKNKTFNEAFRNVFRSQGFYELLG